MQHTSDAESLGEQTVLVLATSTHWMVPVWHELQIVALHNLQGLQELLHRSAAELIANLFVILRRCHIGNTI
jgi:hypothetical protein